MKILPANPIYWSGHGTFYCLPPGFLINSCQRRLQSLAFPRVAFGDLSDISNCQLDPTHPLTSQHSAVKLLASSISIKFHQEQFSGWCKRSPLLCVPKGTARDSSRTTMALARLSGSDAPEMLHVLPGTDGLVRCFVIYDRPLEIGNRPTC